MNTGHEHRVLILAPTGRDAALACEVLEREGLRATACKDVDSVCTALMEGAGVLLLAEEAITRHAEVCLSEALKRQPPWSDLPIIIFAERSNSLAATALVQKTVDLLGNVTFVDRPIRVATLVTTVRTGLRARERQYASRELLVALEGQEEDARRRAEFEKQLVGIVSHDLRNPISAVLMTASVLLKRGEQDERTTKGLLRILTSGERAARMIRDLLDFTQSRLGGGIPIHPQPLDFNDIVQQTVEEVEAAHLDREIVVEREGDGRGQWDGDRIAQTLTNLLTNALNYSPPGTPVRVSSSSSSSGIRLEVANEGTPIPVSLLPSLFEPMQRGAAQVDSSRRSIGLGLYIVKQVVSAHGGTVEVQSSEDGGTLFRVLLPRSVPRTLLKG